MGEIVAQFGSRLGPLPVLCQNPANAVICCGHSKGTVTMWTPSVRGEPVMKILAHRQAVTAVAVDRSGTHMATAAMDKSVRIWDLRNTGGSGGSGAKCLAEFNLSSGSASCLQFSDRKILGASIRPSESVEFFKDVCTVSSSAQSVQYPYMVHKVHRRITDFNFVPFEDVVGIGHADGFSSILVPGESIQMFKFNYVPNCLITVCKVKKNVVVAFITEHSYFINENIMLVFASVKAVVSPISTPSKPTRSRPRNSAKSPRSRPSWRRSQQT